jgi:hypothetical protein
MKTLFLLLLLLVMRACITKIVINFRSEKKTITFQHRKYNKPTRDFVGCKNAQKK